MKTILQTIGTLLYYIWFIFIEALRFIFALLDGIKWWLFTICGGFMFVMWLLYLFATSGHSATPYDGSPWVGIGIGFFVILMVCIATSNLNGFFDWLENGFVISLRNIMGSIFIKLSKLFNELKKNNVSQDIVSERRLTVEEGTEIIENE
jgi:hypothetical protein